MHRLGAANRARRPGRRGFSLPELLVAVGTIALLVSLLLMPLRAAHRQAKATQCAAQLQQIGIALDNTFTQYGHYPIWDDGNSPIRYTWVDVLVQLREFQNRRAAYCPEDPRPSELNAARGAHYLLNYPNQPGKFGIDYSYGIGVPLAAGGWGWREQFANPDDPRPRRFEGHDRDVARRLLVADAGWSWIYNLSGDVLHGSDWSDPTAYDNTVEWRHADRRANVLFQDGHVSPVQYSLTLAEPVDTMKQFVWYPGEPIHVGPEDALGSNYYPNTPPVILSTGQSGGSFPREVVPGYFTHNRLWTIGKGPVP